MNNLVNIPEEIKPQIEDLFIKSPPKRIRKGCYPTGKSHFTQCLIAAAILEKLRVKGSGVNVTCLDIMQETQVSEKTVRGYFRGILNKLEEAGLIGLEVDKAKGYHIFKP